ncbi:unnamed protein product [Cuscuta campestris]|uniref:Glycerol-3-phosphate dehydrogenase [NAD(+)] n=1 Tax=Cuscuta campestris TaxID=132261 RepID=A0A484MUK5_9ASTE|nr:unnamed protein product [Cuscuta campestris]
MLATPRTAETFKEAAALSSPSAEGVSAGVLASGASDDGPSAGGLLGSLSGFGGDEGSSSGDPAASGATVSAAGDEAVGPAGCAEGACAGVATLVSTTTSLLLGVAAAAGGDTGEVLGETAAEATPKPASPIPRFWQWMLGSTEMVSASIVPVRFWISNVSLSPAFIPPIRTRLCLLRPATRLSPPFPSPNRFTSSSPHPSMARSWNAPTPNGQINRNFPPVDAPEDRKSRIAVVGSGNWGSVAAKLIAHNALRLNSFHDEVRMWVFEEVLPTGEKLSEVINRTNENVKYLPGIKLGKNVIADPDLDHAVREANMLVFVTPHQFVEGICRRLVGKIRKDASAISLIKGMEVKKEEGPRIISTLITERLGVNCCVLMGANIANEIAVEMFSEATIGYRENKEIAHKWVQLFNAPYFMVSVVQDVEGVELCGTLKNVVALAAGFVDGLELGNNTKAAIMRIGLKEMNAFAKLLFTSVKDSTFFESCGVADVITTCLGGRNRKCAEAFARDGGKRSFDELEAEMLQGQKLQGVSTAKEVYEVLRYRGWLESFPLFSTVHEICTGRLPPSAIVEHVGRTPNIFPGGRL